MNKLCYVYFPSTNTAIFCNLQSHKPRNVINLSKILMVSKNKVAVKRNGPGIIVEALKFYIS